MTGHLCRLPARPASWADTEVHECLLCGTQWEWRPTDQQWYVLRWCPAGYSWTDDPIGWSDEVRLVNARLPATDDGTSPLVSARIASHQRGLATRLRPGLLTDPAYHESPDVLTARRRPILVDGRDVSADVGHWVRPGEYPDPASWAGLSHGLQQLMARIHADWAPVLRQVGAAAQAMFDQLARQMADAHQALRAGLIRAQLSADQLTRLMDALDATRPRPGRKAKPRRYRAKRPPTRQPAGRAWHQYATRRRHPA